MMHLLFRQHFYMYHNLLIKWICSDFKVNMISSYTMSEYKKKIYIYIYSTTMTIHSHGLGHLILSMQGKVKSGAKAFDIFFLLFSS